MGGTAPYYGASAAPSAHLTQKLPDAVPIAITHGNDLLKNLSLEDDSIITNRYCRCKCKCFQSSQPQGLLYIHPPIGEKCDTLGLRQSPLESRVSAIGDGPVTAEHPMPWCLSGQLAMAQSTCRASQNEILHQSGSILQIPLDFSTRYVYNRRHNTWDCTTFTDACWDSIYDVL